MIRDHREEHRQRHVRVVHRAPLRPFPQFIIRLPARLRSRDDRALHRENVNPHIQHHDRPKHRAEMDERATPAERMREHPHRARRQHEPRGISPSRFPERRTEEQIVDHPSSHERGKPQRHRLPLREHAHSRVDQIRGIARVINDPQKREPREPRERRLPLEPMQRRRHRARAEAPLFHPVKKPAMGHVKLALDTLARLLRRSEGRVQPHKIKRRADPHDAGDEMRHADQKIQPLMEVGHRPF